MNIRQKRKQIKKILDNNSNKIIKLETVYEDPCLKCKFKHFAEVYDGRYDCRMECDGLAGWYFYKTKDVKLSKLLYMLNGKINIDSSEKELNNITCKSLFIKYNIQGYEFEYTQNYINDELFIKNFKKK